MVHDTSEHGSARPARARGQVRTASRSVIVLAALASLTACGSAGLEPADSTSPEDLTYVELATTIRDRVADREVVVHGVVTNFPAPGSDEVPEDVDTLVLVDLTVTTSADLPGEIGPSSFELHSGAGEPLLALTTVDAALTDSTFWPLVASSSTRTQRGWLAFPMSWDTLSGVELVLVRPGTAADPGADGEVAEFSVPLGID